MPISSKTADAKNLGDAGGTSALQISKYSANAENNATAVGR
jgi:hypothetical protein